MISPSFERIDYQLRYNKHIERKLIFDVLLRAQQLIGLSGHQYLGFGSMWFADFRLAHRLLGLHRMISMEHAQYAPRARFNSPYHSIEVKGGNSTAILESINWSIPVVVWLDYDGTLETLVARDLRFVLEKCAPDSVVLITLNAARGSYRPKKEGRRDRIDTALGQVEYMLTPGVVPARFEPSSATASHGDVREEDFPEFLAEAVLSYMLHVVVGNGGRLLPDSAEVQPVNFVPLFNFCHKDGADMITVGGAVAGADDSVWRTKVAVGVELSDEQGLPSHQRLDLVPLTLKEKLVLDSCLPEAEQATFLVRAKNSGIQLHEAELQKYWRHYRHFPVFFEAPV